MGGGGIRALQTAAVVQWIWLWDSPLTFPHFFCCCCHVVPLKSVFCLWVVSPPPPSPCSLVVLVLFVLFGLGLVAPSKS